MEQAGSRAGGEMRRASREGGTLEEARGRCFGSGGQPGESGLCGKEWRAGGDGHLGLGAGLGWVRGQ